MALGSFLSRLGSAALPAAISAYGTYRGGEEDERWKGLDPRTGQGLEGFMSAAQAGLSGLHRHEQEKRARKLERERAEQARMANVISSISPRGGDYRPAPVETPKAGALEQVAQLGGAGIGAYKSALEHSRGLEDRAQLQEQRRLSIEESEDAKKKREREEKERRIAQEVALSGTEVVDPTRDEWIAHRESGATGQITPESLGKFKAQTSPYEEGSDEDTYWKLAKKEFIEKKHDEYRQKELQRIDSEYKRARIKAENRVPADILKVAQERANAFAENIAHANPYSDPEDLEAEILRAMKEEGVDFSEVGGLPSLMSIATSKFNEKTTRRKDKVGDLVKEAIDIGYKTNPEYALNQLKLDLHEIHGINVTPEIMEKAGEQFIGQLEIHGDMGEATKKDLGRLMFLDTEFSSMIENLEDPKFMAKLKDEGNLGVFRNAMTEALALFSGQKAWDDNSHELLQSLRFSSDMLARMRSGAALNDTEWSLYFTQMLGSGKEEPEVILKNLKNQQGKVRAEREAIFTTALELRGYRGDKDKEKKIPSETEDLNFDDNAIFFQRETEDGTETLTWKDADEILRGMDPKEDSPYDPWTATKLFESWGGKEAWATAYAEGKRLSDKGEVPELAPGAAQDIDAIRSGATNVAAGLGVDPETGVGPRGEGGLLQSIGIVDPGGQRILEGPAAGVTQAAGQRDVVPRGVTDIATPKREPVSAEGDTTLTDMSGESDRAALQTAITDTALVPTTADSLEVTERFLPQINESAENHGVPPDIIRKMIYVESSGRPAIINEDSGSVGLLQITPIAAKDLGIAYDVEQLSDPAYNIEQGTKFLKLQYDRVKRANPNLSEEELWRQAVTAYHAGFGNLQKGNLGPKSRQYPESVFGSNAEEDTMADSLQMTPG